MIIDERCVMWDSDAEDVTHLLVTSDVFESDQCVLADKVRVINGYRRMR